MTRKRGILEPRACTGVHHSSNTALLHTQIWKICPLPGLRFFLGWGRSAKRKLFSCSDQTVLIKVTRGICACSFSSGMHLQSTKFLMDIRFSTAPLGAGWSNLMFTRWYWTNQRVCFWEKWKFSSIYWCWVLIMLKKHRKSYPDWSSTVLCIVSCAFLFSFAC